MTREEEITERRILRVLARNAAEELWASFDTNEKTGVRFGLFPAAKLRECKHINQRDLVLALMDCAEKDGGMIA